MEKTANPIFWAAKTRKDQTFMPNTLICGPRNMAHTEAHTTARKAANGFLKAGVTEGGTVATMMRNDFPVVVMDLAAAMVKAAAVPINWRFTAEEAAYILADCKAKVFVLHSDLWNRIGADLPENLIDDLEIVIVPTPADIAETYGLPAEDCALPEDFPTWDSWLSDFPLWDGPNAHGQAAMIYTSGTTGHPKGVRRLTNPTLVSTGYNKIFNKDCKTLMVAPMYHSAPNRFAMLTVDVGGDLILVPRFDPETILQIIETEKITTAFMVPTMFIRLLKLPDTVRRQYDISSLRHIVAAGAPFPPDIKEAMIKWWGPVIYEYYGGTETGAVTLCSSEEALARPGTVGRAVEDATVKIFNEDGTECPPNVPGEIYCRLHSFPDFVYEGRPEDRKAVERDGLFTVGDIGYLDEEGYLFISDRKRDMIISGGVNIYPAEIEAAMFNHEQVHDCAVFGIPDPDLGEAIAVAIQPEPDATIDTGQLQSFLKGRIANYMIPRKILIKDSLPRDDNGKIFKRKLRDAFWADAGRQI